MELKEKSLETKTPEWGQLPKHYFLLYSKTFGLTVLLSHNDIGGDLKLLETKEVYS